MFFPFFQKQLSEFSANCSSTFRYRKYYSYFDVSALSFQYKKVTSPIIPQMSKMIMYRTRLFLYLNPKFDLLDLIEIRLATI
jgi:hypothetical protein